jgi:hypothetical protein
MLPSFVNELDIRRVKIGDSVIDLRFEATRAGEVQVEVVKNSGSIKVDVEEGQEHLEAA